MQRSMAIGKNQVAALRFTKRSQFCMHSREIPPLLGLPLRWARSFKAREYPALPSLRSQPIGRSLSSLHKRALGRKVSDEFTV